MDRILARLGEDATFTHAGGSPVSVRGLFLSPHASALHGLLGAGLDGSKPRFAAMTADFTPSLAEGDVLSRSSVSYSISEIETDDPSGISVVALVKT